MLNLIRTDLDGRTDTGQFFAAGPDGLRCGYSLAPATRLDLAGDTPVLAVLRVLLANRPLRRP